MTVAPNYSAELDALFPELLTAIAHGLEHLLPVLDIFNAYITLADTEFINRHQAAVLHFFSEVARTGFSAAPPFPLLSFFLFRYFSRRPMLAP
jgi:hypothetical protein